MRYKVIIIQNILCFWKLFIQTFVFLIWNSSLKMILNRAYIPDSVYTVLFSNICSEGLCWVQSFLKIFFWLLRTTVISCPLQCWSNLVSSVCCGICPGRRDSQAQSPSLWRVWEPWDSHTRHGLQQSFSGELHIFFFFFFFFFGTAFA